MNFNDLSAAMNEANLNKEFEPGQWPVDEDLIKWLVKYFTDHAAGFRKVLEDITIDELLKKPAIVLDKFDEYFN